MKHKTKHLVGALSLLLALTAWSQALDIARYSSPTYDRFVAGTYPSAPQENPAFDFAALDWSGVGWNTEDPRKSVAMISPKHFVAASHFVPSGHLAFRSPDGTEVVAEISSAFHRLVDPVSGRQSDMYVGELNSPIPAECGITAYPIMDLETPGAYIGLPLLVYGHQPASGGGAAAVSVGVNTFEGFFFDFFSEQTFYFDQDKAGGEAQAQAGDSGSPTFTAVGSTLALLGAHHTIGTMNRRPVTHDTFAPSFIGQIRDIIGAAGYSLALPPAPPVAIKGGGGGKGR